MTRWVVLALAVALAAVTLGNASADVYCASNDAKCQDCQACPDIYKYQQICVSLLASRADSQSLSCDAVQRAIDALSGSTGSECHDYEQLVGDAAFNDEIVAVCLTETNAGLGVPLVTQQALKDLVKNTDADATANLNCRRAWNYNGWNGFGSSRQALGAAAQMAVRAREFAKAARSIQSAASDDADVRMNEMARKASRSGVIEEDADELVAQHVASRVALDLGSKSAIRVAQMRRKKLLRTNGGVGGPLGSGKCPSIEEPEGPRNRDTEMSELEKQNLRARQGDPEQQLKYECLEAKLYKMDVYRMGLAMHWEGGLDASDVEKWMREVLVRAVRYDRQLCMLPSESDSLGALAGFMALAAPHDPRWKSRFGLYVPKPDLCCHSTCHAMHASINYYYLDTRPDHHVFGQMSSECCKIARVC